jgi:hypothetical protein
MGRLAAVEIGKEALRRPRARALFSALFVWSIWVAATVAVIWYIRQYTRNVPYFDDFTVIPVMTGHRPMTYRWLTEQYNEHRNVVPRLIQVTLLRVVPDFRAGLYLNAGLLSATAAAAILLARRLRGETRVVDAVLPLSILTLGQCECLLVGFALNLVLTAWIAWRITGIIGHSAHPPGWWPCLRIGTALVLLPLCGGSGMAMLPPLVLWLAGYLAFGWWSGRDPGPWVRAIGVALLMAAAATVAWYLAGYRTPAHIPPPPSASAIGATMLEVCGLVIEPVGLRYWRIAGLSVILLSAATVVLLGIAAWRSPHERPRALGLLAILTSILIVALAVGYSRSGLGPGTGRCCRYITIVMPLLGVVYIAWLLYAPVLARRAIHVALLALICAGIPEQARFARRVGSFRRGLYCRVEAALQRGLPRSRVVDLAYPVLFPQRSELSTSFQLLKEGRVGKFRYMSDDRHAARPDDQVRVK